MNRLGFLAAFVVGLLLAATVGFAADQGASAPDPNANGPWTMGPGMMGQGGGPWNMGPGMMGQGRGNWGPGMMGQGFGPGGMGPWMMGRGGRGMMGGCNYLPLPTRELTVDDVKKTRSARLESGGNKRLKLGEVKDGGADSVLADIVTVDNSLVERIKVDKKTGWMSLAE
jgi:hypothetical protein